MGPIFLLFTAVVMILWGLSMFARKRKRLALVGGISIGAGVWHGLYAVLQVVASLLL